MKNLNILHINTQLKSGSATIPYRIHEGYIKQGYNSLFLTADCDDANKYKNVIQIPNQKISITISRIIRNIWFGKIRGKDEYYFFPQVSVRSISKRKIVNLIKNPPDIIIAYWTNFFFTQKLLNYISSYFNAPVILYLMDEEPYTGGCHMTFNCNNYETGCGNCAALKFSHRFDISYRSFKKKKKWVQKTNVIALAATTFSNQRLMKSPIFSGIQKQIVHLPIDDIIFSPYDKCVVREELNLPKDKKIILFGGASFERINKGMRFLVESLKLLKKSIANPDKIHILIVGNGEVSSELPFKYTHLGYLKTQEEMAKAYQSCDVFVCPTIQDAGPAMINEANMCGRPVVSFETGVANDLIINYETGYVAKTKDISDLAFGLKTIIEYNDEKQHNVEMNCRKIGLEKCSFNNQLKKIVNLANNRIMNESL